MNMLVVMCGIPGSGKSTYAKKLIEMHPDWKYVSRDEVRYEYITDQAHYFDHENEVYKEFCNRIDMHLLNGCTVIADATHLNKASRDKLLRSLTAPIDKKVVIVVNTAFTICMERNAVREGITRVPDQSMYRMKNIFKKPSLVVEDFDQILNVNGGKIYD